MDSQIFQFAGHDEHDELAAQNVQLTKLQAEKAEKIP